ncbi:MAG: hypothetical protein NWE98_03715 [Candidatus Bathyarchaeota archaeon]|nr:hypothetical protein [Candidatus Bathyarchaeota archaeon]
MSSRDSDLSILSTFINGKLQMIYITDKQGPIHTNQAAITDGAMAHDFLTNYQAQTQDVFLWAT